MRHNAVAAQQQGISRWLVKFGQRRPSEAAMEVATMPTWQRRKMFRDMVMLGLIEWRDNQWHAVKGAESGHLEAEQIAAYIDGGLTTEEFKSANDHLAKCTECTTLLANTIKTKQELAK